MSKDRESTKLTFSCLFDIQLIGNNIILEEGWNINNPVCLVITNISRVYFLLSGVE